MTDLARNIAVRPQVDEQDELDASLAMHDDLLARRGVELWIGGEPTFTRADSIEPAWTTAAEGDDKLARGVSFFPVEISCPYAGRC